MDALIGELLNGMEKADRLKVEKRFKFMVHPDKNTHADAKEAFQKMCNSLWKWKSKRSRSRGCLLLNILPIFTPVACAA